MRLYGVGMALLSPSGQPLYGLRMGGVGVSLVSVFIGLLFSSVAFADLSSKGAKMLNVELWEDGLIPLVFDSSVTDPEKKMVFEACKVWEDVANVHCVEGPYKDRELSVTKHDNLGCFCIWGMGTSYLFLQRWMNLASGCWSHPTLLHELGHAFGMIHEHQRPDRDQYVTVVSDNVASGFFGLNYSANFDVQDAEMYVPYDFFSIMHYSRKAASSNGEDTIVPKPEYQGFIDLFGRVKTISEGDAFTLQKMYGPPSPK